MKKILSIMAVAAGALYLAAGVGLLVFQDVFKTGIMGYISEPVKVYPVQNVLELAVMGIPCVVLGVLAMSDSSAGRRGLDLLLTVYSSIMLVLGGVLTIIGSMVNNIIVARTQGAEGLANMSIVSTCFGFIRFLIDLSLVMLLLRGALSLGESAQPGRVAQ